VLYLTIIATRTRDICYEAVTLDAIETRQVRIPDIRMLAKRDTISLMGRSASAWRRLKVDRVSRAIYQMRLKIEYLDRDGNSFQDLFAAIMAKRHPEHFYPVRPWGRAGDKKNDGYLASERTLFQVYAPYDMTATEAIAKINDDFNGALPHWRQYFDKWVFVHNAAKGLPPHVVKKLLDLGAANPSITVTHWGYEALRDRAMALSEHDLSELFGPPFSYADMSSLGLPELIPVLEAIERGRPLLEQDIRPVPADKIAINDLSTDVKYLLTIGMTRSDLVEDYFQDKAPDPSYGDELATTFRGTYQAFRRQGLGSDDTFAELVRFAGGSQRGTTTREGAIYAVLAVESCIFCK